MIPEKWKISRINELSHYITSGSRGWAQYYSDNGDLFVRITNLTRERVSLDLTDSKYVKIPEDNNEGKRTRLMTGDILISITADLGIIGFIGDELNKPTYINQHIALLRINEKEIHHKFVAYQMASESGHKQFLSQNDAGAKSSLNLDSIRKFSITIPPLPEQCKIAEILGAWDESIALLEKLITAKRKLKQGLMQQLLTGKKRFKEFEGEEWEIKKIKDIGKVVSGGTPDTNNRTYWNGDIPWCTPSEITALKDKYINFTNRTISTEGVKSSSTAILPVNSLLVCTRATIGYGAINTVSMCTNQGFKNLLPKNQYYVEFLYYKLQLEKSKLLRLASGSTFLEISKKDFELIELDIPPFKEQQKIASVLSAADTEISNLEKQLAAYKQQKRGLMQQLLTGKTRVNVN